MRHFNLLNNFRWFATVILLIMLGAGQMWGDPKVSDLNFGTTLVNENFNSLSTCNNRPGNTKNGTVISSQTAYGVFTDGYVGKSTSLGFGIFAAADPFDSKYLKVYGDGSKVAGLYLNNTSIPTAGAFDVYISKASVGYFGLFSAVDNTNTSNKSYTVAYFWWDGTTLKISDGNTSSHSWQSVGTPTTDSIRVTVVYNESGSNTTYGSSISISNARAHVYVNGSAVMNGASPKEFTIATGRNPYYFRVTTNSSSGLSIDDLKIYNALPTAAATCSNDPSVGAASINGSFNGGGVTSLTNISNVFSAASSAAGSATCSITEYGFVWSDGSTNTNPAIDGSGVTKENHSGAPSGDGGSFSSNMVGTWVVDHTYYYKAYVKNGRPATAYSTASPAASFTVRGITFDSNDGSSVSTKYIKSGGVMTAPTAPTKDGNVFAGWYSNEELTSAVDWSSAVTSSATYYAKWYSVTVNVKDEAGNTLSGSGKPTASCTGTTLSTSAGSEKYVFKEWQVSNTASLGSDATTASNSLTSITGNVTVTAVYHAPIALTKGTNTGASTFNFSSNPIGYGETLTITCAADASHKGSPTVTASGTHGTITIVSATSVTIANVQSAMTVNISYAAKEAAVVKLHVAGSTSTISGTRYEGDSYTLPSEAAECPDMGLYGWYTTDYEHATTAPSGANFKLPGASATLAAGDNDFYAVYATVTPDAANTYTEITSVGQLVTGDYLIGAGSSGGYCMSNNITDSHMAERSMSVSDGVVTNSSYSDLIWHITKSGDNYTFYNAAAEKYLALSTASTPVLQTSAHNFTASYTSSSWLFSSTTVSGYQLAYYVATSYFESSTSKGWNIHLFKRDPSVAGPYTTTPSCTTHTLTVNMDPVAPDGCSAAAVKTVLGETKTTTATATAGDHYVFSYWTISGTGSTMSNTSDGKSTDNPVTVTMGTADATLTAHFTEKEKCTVVFKNNGTQLSSTTYWRGENPVAPTLTDGTDHDACDETSDTHYGWTQTAWQNTLEQAAIDAKTAADVKVYAKDATLPAITAGDDGTTITYHAVWAEGSGGTTTISIDGSGLQAVVEDQTSGYDDFDFSVGGYTFHVSAATKCTDSGTAQYWFQLKKNNDAITIPTLPGKITNISSTAIRTATSGSVSTGVYFNSSATTSAAIASETLSSATSFSLDVTGNNSSGYLLFGAATCINQLSVTYSTASYSKYLTTCCEYIVDAPTVTGIPTKNSITLEWTNVANATGYTVTSSGGTPGDVTSDGTARSCVITGLSPNTNYTWSVVATYTTPYCAANTANGNTTTSQVYAVTYNKNGGTIANLPSGGSYAAGEEVTVAAKPDGNVNKSGYTFTGWNTANDGSGEHYDADGSTSFTMPSEAVVLYAEWTAKKNYFVDRMHGNWDGEHTEPTTGYNCYLREGAGYTVPDLSDDATGSNSCVSGHEHFIGWVIASKIGAQGQLLSGYTVIKGGTVQTAGTDGTIYYAVWAEE